MIPPLLLDVKPEHFVSRITAHSGCLPGIQADLPIRGLKHVVPGHVCGSRFQSMVFPLHAIALGAPHP
jgi:hypothetical protein